MTMSAPTTPAVQPEAGIAAGHRLAGRLSATGGLLLAALSAFSKANSQPWVGCRPVLLMKSATLWGL